MRPIHTKQRRSKIKKDKVVSFNDRVQDAIEKENYNRCVCFLFEKGLISNKTITEYFGFDYEEEQKNKKEEKGA